MLPDQKGVFGGSRNCHISRNLEEAAAKAERMARTWGMLANAGSAFVSSFFTFTHEVSQVTLLFSLYKGVDKVPRITRLES